MNRIARNVFANWAGLAINVVIAFLMSPFLVHSLGDTMYGLWVLLLAVTGYMGLLDAGLKVAVVKFISRAHATGDRVEMSRVVSTVLLLHGTMSVIIIAVALVASPFVPGLFEIAPENLRIARVVLLITAINLALTLAMSVFNGVLAGLQRYDSANIIGVGVMIVRSALTVLVIKAGYGIVALGLVHTLAQVTSGLLLTRAAFRHAGGLQIRRSLIDMPTVKRLYGYGSFVLLNSVAMFLLFNSAEIVIGAVLGAAAVTYYAIAGSLLQYLSQLIGVATQVLHPYAASQDARGDAEGLQRTIITGTKACMMIALPATVTFIVIGREFILFWMGPAYADAAAPLIVVLGIGRLFWLSQSSAGNVLMGAGHHKVLTTTTLATGIAGLIVGSLLVGRLGLFGLALGMTLPLVIGLGTVLPYRTVKAFAIRPLDYVREGYWEPLASTLPYIATLLLARAVVRPDNLFELAATVVVSLPVLAVAMYLICLSATQRRRLSEVYGRWIPRSAA